MESFAYQQATVSLASVQCLSLIIHRHVTLLTLLVFGSVQLADANPQSVTIAGQINVFDGDTLEIGPVLIRLHGVDAPEKTQRCKTATGTTWRCGLAAVQRVRTLIEGQDISCEALDRDPYGRIISRCFVGGHDIGEALIADGLAWAFTEYSDDYVSVEGEARAAATGVWEAETQTPWDFRDDKWNCALVNAPDGKCPIKGNISPGKKKRKIYHTPWSPNYSNTKIKAEDGERWFCDEAEALAAGWRPVAER